MFLKQESADKIDEDDLRKRKKSRKMSVAATYLFFTMRQMVRRVFFMVRGVWMGKSSEARVVSAL